MQAGSDLSGGLDRMGTNHEQGLVTLGVFIGGDP